jgi:hypothetical protein
MVKNTTLFYAFFWVIPWRLNFICRRFGTLCLFHLHKRISMKNDGLRKLEYSNILKPSLSSCVPIPPMKMEQTECSETSAYKIQTPGNYPEESIHNSEHGESLKAIIPLCLAVKFNSIVTKIYIYIFNITLKH